MIERLVFISTLVLILMIGINGFLAMGNELCMPNGTKLNLTTKSNLPCGTLNPMSSGAGDINGMITAANQITPNSVTGGATTNTPAGTAQSVINFIINAPQSAINGLTAGYLGIQWLFNTMTQAQQLGNVLAAEIPFLAPLIFIFSGIVTILEAFALMYWTMAGARALLGRFL